MSGDRTSQYYVRPHHGAIRQTEEECQERVKFFNDRKVSRSNRAAGVLPVPLLVPASHPAVLDSPDSSRSGKPVKVMLSGLDMRICMECGNEFYIQKLQGNKRTCTDECAAAREKRMTSERNKRHRQERKL